MILSHEKGNITIVVPRTRHLTSENAKRFKQQMEPILSTGRRVALDMRPLDFVDSAGLGALLSCLKRASKLGAEFSLFGITPQVRTIFSLIRMDQVVVTASGPPG